MKRRERIVINRSYQWKVIGLIAGALSSGFLLMGGFAWLLTDLLQQALMERPVLLEHIQEQVWYYGSVIGVAYLLLFALSILLAIRITHRLVGPVNRLRDELEVMRRTDDLGVLAVREEDELDDLVKSINKLILHLRQKQDGSVD